MNEANANVPTQSTAIEGREQGQVEVRDAVLWLNHIKGAPLLQSKLLSMSSEEVVVLRVTGRLSVWERMRDGKDGRPTLGLKPRDAHAKELWRALYPARAGQCVTISDPE